MKSDTNIVKLLGIFGALFAFLSMFMNVITLDFRMGIDSGVLLQEDETENIGIHMRYGLTMWELRTMVGNFVDSISWDEEELEENQEIVEDYDLSYLEDMLGMYGMVLDETTIDDLLAFVTYSVSSYLLFIFLPWFVMAGSIAMVVGTLMSKHVVKVISAALLLVGFVLLFLPPGGFFRIIGVGPVIFLLGCLSSIISTVGSFVSPGVIYIEE